MSNSKLHFGHGVLFVMIIFASGISYLVYRCYNQRVDLVSADYYDQEINHDKKMEKIKNNSSLTDPISISIQDFFINIKYPNNLKSIIGKVKFYKPDNESYDSEKEITFSNGYQIIPLNDIRKGRWKVSIDGISNGIGYYYEKYINVK